MIAVRVEPGGNARLALGLSQLMTAVGDGSTLHWRLFWASFVGDVRSVWRSGHEHLEAQSQEPGGVPVTWAQMVRLGRTDAQIIDGEFVGFDADGTPQLQFMMSDSSYWTVWSTRPTDYLRLGESFETVTVSHRQPDPLRMESQPDPPRIESQPDPPRMDLGQGRFGVTGSTSWGGPSSGAC